MPGIVNCRNFKLSKVHLVSKCGFTSTMHAAKAIAILGNSEAQKRLCTPCSSQRCNPAARIDAR